MKKRRLTKKKRIIIKIMICVLAISLYFVWCYGNVRLIHECDKIKYDSIEYVESKYYSNFYETNDSLIIISKERLCYFPLQCNVYYALSKKNPDFIYFSRGQRIFLKNDINETELELTFLKYNDLSIYESNEELSNGFVLKMCDIYDGEVELLKGKELQSMFSFSVTTLDGYLRTIVYLYKCNDDYYIKTIVTGGFLYKASNILLEKISDNGLI